MNKIKCIIIDDEPSGIIVLRELLSLYCSNVKVVCEAENSEVAFQKITEHKPDFILLDIQMPGETGFDLLKRFDKIDFDIIFVTSYDKYAINAIKFSALDYLLKPVEVHELCSAIEKVKVRKFQKKEKEQLVINLLNNLDKKIMDKKMAIHHFDKVKFLNLSDIVCFEAESNYTSIYTIAEEKYTPARVLKDFECFLKDHKIFMRINKSVIINLEYIKEYSKGEPCILYLKNGREFEISRRKKTELSEKVRG